MHLASQASGHFAVISDDDTARRLTPAIHAFSVVCLSTIRDAKPH